MTLQHSPGPFTFDRYGWYIFDSEDNVIAEVNSAHPGDGQIFAAAPEMLRLLRVFSVPITLQRLESGQLRAALKETDELLARLDGDGEARGVR